MATKPKVETVLGPKRSILEKLGSYDKKIESTYKERYDLIQKSAHLFAPLVVGEKYWRYALIPKGRQWGLCEVVAVQADVNNFPHTWGISVKVLNVEGVSPNQVLTFTTHTDGEGIAWRRENDPPENLIEATDELV